jgi:hypothetical protein
VRAANQQCRQPIKVGNCPDPTGGLGQLVSRDGVLADQGDLWYLLPDRWSPCRRPSTQAATVDLTGD